MIALDSSALIKRYQREEHSDWIRATMDDDGDWCGSMLLATESAVASARNSAASDELSKVDLRMRADLDHFQLVPVDGDCLVRAIEIGRAHRLRTLDAIHLAAAARLPAECRFVTFDERQAEAAAEIGLDLLAPDQS
ncbi:MAG TPA: type II toxin-antitoxin system VapC family toxin [Solirubrobacterales bacterium]|nr:type II toxin-antitoxin system VapC family toxin [Solirubrobacterales bacterium]